MKNFSLLETASGDYILSPAYDLLNTRIHVADTAFALKNGLFADGSVKNPKQKDLLDFGLKIGIKESRIDKIFANFLNHKGQVQTLINQSFLDDRTKRGYGIHFNTRLNVMMNK